MITADEEHFLRSSLLLLKGSLFITKKIILREEQREIQQNGLDIDDLLKTYKQKLEQQFKNYKQREILFPKSGKTKVENWDISLLTGVLLIVFQSSLSDDERKALKHIKYQRNEIYAHTAVASLSVKDYDDICSELNAAYDTLASGFNSDVKEQCNNNVETCLKGPLDLKTSLELLKKMSETDDMFREILTRIDTSGKETTLALTNTFRQESSAVQNGLSKDISRSENNICNVIRDLQLKKEDLYEIVLNALRQTQQEKRVKRKVKVVDSELEVSGNETDQASVDEAEDILVRVTNEAIRRAKTSEENIYIREKIQEILDNIECQTDLKALAAEKGCVVIKFDCSTYEQLFNFIIYMESEDMKERLNKLAVSLSCRLNTKDKLRVSFSLSFKTLQSLVQELETNCRKEYKRSVRIPIQVDSVQGMIRLLEIFEGGALTNNLNKLSEALTEKVGAKINVKSSININKLTEALEEFDYITEATMQIDKTEKRSGDKREMDHEEDTDLKIENAKEKTSQRIASDCITEATMQIDKTEDRSGDKRETDADHEEDTDVKIEKAKEKTSRRIASDYVTEATMQIDKTEDRSCDKRETDADHEEDTDLKIEKAKEKTSWRIASVTDKKLRNLKKSERQIKPVFDEAFSKLQETFDMYTRSKHHIIFRRYAEIKKITKDCIDIDARTELTDDYLEENESNTTGFLGKWDLLQKRTALISENAQRAREIEKLSKGELKRNIEQTNDQLAEMKQKLQQLDNDIMLLDANYQESKSLFFLRRYRSRKRALKSFLTKYGTVLWTIKRQEMPRLR